MYFNLFISKALRSYDLKKLLKMIYALFFIFAFISEHEWLSGYMKLFFIFGF